MCDEETKVLFKKMLKNGELDDLKRILLPGEKLSDLPPCVVWVSKIVRPPKEAFDWAKKILKERRVK